jgi:nucleotide-binding universal stress UspA family protein
MTRVVVPVRYPLTEHSGQTLARAIEVAGDRDADLTVVHVDLFQAAQSVTRTDLQRAVEEEFGHVPRARYVVRKGSLVEETILEEIASEDADIVVIGDRQQGRFRRMLQRVFDGPEVDKFLAERLDCAIVTVS